jgi:hypothetical protein
MNAVFNLPSRSVIPNCVFGFIARTPLPEVRRHAGRHG